MVFGNNKNLIYLEIPSLISPGVSPPGRYLPHGTNGAPCDARHPDHKKELDNTLEELKKNFPGSSTMPSISSGHGNSGEAPGIAHRWVGHTLPVTTSIPNLYNVGDGCTMPGTIGTEGAATSAREVAKQILAA